MIRHVLLLQPRHDVKPAEIEAARQAITELLGRIPGLLNVHWGENVAPANRQDGFTHGFSMDFEDRASLDAYTPNPIHQAAASHVRAAFERVIVFDWSL
jgi:hypothetical protein